MTRYVAGPRSKYLVALIAIVFAAGLASQSGKLEEVQKSDTADFLPGNAESVLALQKSREFPSGQTSPAVVVVARADGNLTREDRAFLEAFQGFVSEADFPLAGGKGPPPQVQKQAAAVTVLLDGTDSDAVAEAVEHLRDWTKAEAPGGLEVAVTGPAAFSTDLKNVFSGADTKLLMVTGGLVFLLLILIYRSPIFWLIPFFTVLLAEGASRGMAALLGEAGLTINGENAGILSVLVFGAATDYALLLVARYREELHRHEDRHDAMAVALRGATPAILASGGTVIAGLLTLLVADVDSTASIGPLGAAGIALALLFSLTVLPATLLIAGRRAFWPFVPRYNEKAAASDHTTGFWPALGRRITARPRPLWIGSVLLLCLLALGLTGADTSLTQEEQLRAEPEAVTGQALLAEHFPAGATAPASIVAPDRRAAAEIQSALEGEPELIAAVLGVEEGPPGAQLTAVLASDPFGEEAVASIPAIREIVHEAEPSALVGGPTAQSFDLREAAERDNVVVPPLTLLVVLIILMVLLRAVLAPVLLLVATALSAAAALGAGVLIFEHILNLPALDPTLPLLAFVFLVALGVDYTIFLMARTREETEKHGTREGVIRALITTGGVITSAGIVLAGTFSALAVLPLVLLTELGVVVAFGVMLDTVLVRSVLVPALVTDIGPRVWWPRRSR